VKRRLLGWLIPALIFLVYAVLRYSIRWQFVGECYQAGCKPYLLSFWHSRILMMAVPYQKWHGVVMVSEHRDGEYIAQAGKYMGIASIRGSSTRGGIKALLQMIRLGRDGYSLGITPDGPKGPAEKVQMGTVTLAKKTGLPLRAVSYATKKHWRAKSWDRFYIPKPFTQGVFVIGEPVYALEDDEQTLASFQQEMDKVQQQAEHYFDALTS